MFRTGKELNLNPIKLCAKGGTKELSDLQKEINEDLYFYFTLKLNSKAKNNLLSRIEYLGKRVKKLDCQKYGKKRKEEFLGVLRKYYLILKNYNPTEDRETVLANDIQVSKYFVSLYLYKKRELGEAPGEEFCFEWLKKIRKFCKSFTPSKSLLVVYKELLEYIDIDTITTE